MPAASACAVSSPAVASGTCRPPPTTCASYTGSLSAAPDQPPRGTPTAIGPSSGPPEARQGRLSALLDRFKRQRPAIQQQPPEAGPLQPSPGTPYLCDREREPDACPQATPRLTTTSRWCCARTRARS